MIPGRVPVRVLTFRVAGREFDKLGGPVNARPGESRFMVGGLERDLQSALDFRRRYAPGEPVEQIWTTKGR